MKANTLSKEDQKIINGIYHKGHGKYLKLTMLDIKRLFADRQDIDHFDDLRACGLMQELEARVLKYAKAGGKIQFSPESTHALTTLSAIN